MKLLKFSLIALTFLFVSCQKEEGASTATITFLEPTSGDTLHIGEKLHVEGTIQGDGEMHGYSLSMTNKNTGESVYMANSDTHAESYAIHEHWTNNVSDTATIKILVEVELNHDGMKTAKEINVVCLPN